MFDKPEQVPVLFLIYNRPDLTAKVFSKIREAKPEKLFINADGPNPGKVGDEKRVEKTREVVQQVDWDCDLQLNFHKTNKGCRDSVNSGLDWFFGNVEAGIILEDDTQPNLSFFRFCQELLNKYWDDNRIMQISGTNTQFGWRRDPDYSYYFSMFGPIWGWATWRRVWEMHDKEMSNWKEIESKGYIFDIFDFLTEGINRKEKLNKVYSGISNTWDTQWQLTRFVNHGLTVISNINLVTNIGFGGGGAHSIKKSKKANMPAFEHEFPLKHPPFMIRDKLSDIRQYKNNLRRGISWRLRKVFNIMKINIKYYF